MSRPISRAELNALLRAARYPLGFGRWRDWMLVYLLAHTGLRISEALELTVGDLRLDLEIPAIAIHSLKRRKRALDLVELERTVANRLRWYIKHELPRLLAIEVTVLPRDPLFPAVKGRGGTRQRMTRRNAAKLFARWRARARLYGKVSLHSLRHYRGTVLYHTTKDLSFTQEQLRHSRLESTRRYLHNSPERRKAYHRQLETPDEL